MSLTSAVTVSTLALACAAPAATDDRALEDGWVLGDPARCGFDQAALHVLTDDLAVGDFPNTHAVLIESDGKLVYERYFHGTDERWGEPLGERVLGPDSLHDLRSVSKSVTSVLLGLALGEDFEAEVARPVVDLLPRLEVEDAKRAITLHHVLTMTAGLEWNEMTVPYTDPANDEIRMYAAEDPARYVLGNRLVHAPGTTWYYSGGLTQVLAAIVEERAGEPLSEFARDRLFAPLGITAFEWLGPEHWEAAMSGLRLRARDLAKIGSVYLNGGRWQGRQIVPEEWVELSLARHVPEIGDWSRGGVWGYGYQWWVGRLPSGERVAAALGNGNQRVYLLPELGVAVTILAGEYNRFEGHSYRLLERIVAARSDGR